MDGKTEKMMFQVYYATNGNPLLLGIRKIHEMPVTVPIVRALRNSAINDSTTHPIHGFGL